LDDDVGKGERRRAVNSRYIREERLTSIAGM
jgi:hypothetical protein